jgi:hypothetical protein
MSRKKRRLTSCQNFIQTCQDNPNFLDCIFSFLRRKLPSKERGSRMLKTLRKLRFHWRPLPTLFRNFLNDSINVFKYAEIPLNRYKLIFIYSFHTSSETVLPDHVCKPSKFTEAVTILIPIRELPGSNLG